MYNECRCKHVEVYHYESDDTYRLETESFEVTGLTWEELGFLLKAIGATSWQMYFLPRYVGLNSEEDL